MTEDDVIGAHAPPVGRLVLGALQSLRAAANAAAAPPAPPADAGDASGDAAAPPAPSAAQPLGFYHSAHHAKGGSAAAGAATLTHEFNVPLYNNGKEHGRLSGKLEVGALCVCPPAPRRR